MDLSIIIISWNVLEKLRNNLTALYYSKGNLNFEIFVVDNNSSDGSAEMVKKEFEEVKLIDNQKNLGFAKANNQAIKKSKGEFILLLNPDMWVLPDTLNNMVKWMRENDKASIAGCHLVDEIGNTIKHVRRFPNFLDQIAIVLKLPHLFPFILNKYLCSNFDYSKTAKVDSIRGGFFMIRPRRNLRGQASENENLPLLDERYFLWFEEVDFCKQAKKDDLEVWYTPTAKCVDYIGQSFKQVSRLQTQKYFRDSMLQYFKKWHPVWQYWILKFVWIIGLFFAWISDKINLKSSAKT